METLKALLYGSTQAPSEQEGRAVGEGGLRDSLRHPPSSLASRWATPSVSPRHRLGVAEREEKGGLGHSLNPSDLPYLVLTIPLTWADQPGPNEAACQDFDPVVAFHITPSRSIGPCFPSNPFLLEHRPDPSQPERLGSDIRHAGWSRDAPVSS